MIDLPTKFQFSLVLNVEDLTVYHSFASTHELENPPSTIPRVQPTPEIIDSILRHKYVSTRREGYNKFLVQWASKPKLEVWLQDSETHHLNPQLLQDYIKH